MREELQDLRFKLNGEPRTVQTPVFDLGDYVIRSWNDSDFEQIASFTDPSMYKQLDVESLEKLTETGYSFEPGKTGAVGFVAQEKTTGDIAGRSYIETRHGDDFTNPRYRQTDEGIQVIAGQEQMQNAERLVELGGWLVRQDHRGKNLSQALVYASIDFIKKMQEEGYRTDVAFITNIGPLRPRDNPEGINYAARMEDAILANGYDPSDLTALASQKNEQGNGPIVVTPDQFREIFSDLSTSMLVDGRKMTRKYRFGDPRNETAPAYHISKKIVEGRDLISYSDENGRRTGRASPVPFLSSREMNILHGGSYTVADFRTSNQE